MDAGLLALYLYDERNREIVHGKNGLVDRLPDFGGSVSPKRYSFLHRTTKALGLKGVTTITGAGPCLVINALKSGIFRISMQKAG
jgi:hypothetical protein